MKIKTLILLTIFFGLIVLPLLSAQEYAVVINKENSHHLSKKDIAQIFLLKVFNLPDGQKVIPINRPLNSEIMKIFSKKILGKRPNQLRAFYHRLIFTGRGTPPTTVESSEMIKSKLKEDTRKISLLKQEEVDESLRVIFTF